MRLSRLLLALLFLSALLPYLFLVYEFPNLKLGDTQELLWAIKNTCLQALLSALVIMSLAVLGVFGLSQASLYDQNFTRPILKPILSFLMLLPSFAPALFLLLSILQIFDPFPVGLIGISLVHAFMYWGFAAVLLFESVQKRSSSLIEVSTLLGASSFRSFFSVVLPVHRAELFSLFIYFFSTCFVSFSVPLVVGGGKGTTIEVLIYEKIRISGDWGPAVALSLLQSFLLLGLSLLANRKTSLSVRSRRASLSLLNSRSLFAFIVMLSMIPVYGFLSAVIEGLPQISRLREVETDFWNYALSSLWMGLSSGLLVFALLVVTIYSFRDRKALRWLRSVIPASSALFGFCLLFFGPNESYHPFWKIPLGLSLLSFPYFLKLGWIELLESKQGQIQTAECLGGTDVVIAKQILLPQLLDRASQLAAYMGMWAVGDFALSKILAHKNLTLAMEIETLMSSYRISLAALLALSLIPVAALVYLLLRSLKYVQRSKA